MKKITPIIIGGCPRSGTTLLGSILGSGRKVVCLPEAPFLPDTIFDLFQNDFEVVSGKLIKELLLSDDRFLTWNLRLECDEELFGSAQDFTNYLISLYCESLGENSNELAQFVDHSPHNLHLNELWSKVYPECKFIHLIRDGRAVAASLKRVYWGPPSVRQSAHYWMSNLAVGLSTEELLKDRALRVHYEKLVSNPKCEIRRICDFVDIEFDERMLLANGYNVIPYTKSQHELVGKSIKVNRVDGWKDSLTQTDINCFEYYAHGLLKNLGYTPVYSIKRPSLMYMVYDSVIRFIIKRPFLKVRRIIMIKRTKNLG